MTVSVQAKVKENICIILIRFVCGIPTISCQLFLEFINLYSLD